MSINAFTIRDAQISVYTPQISVDLHDSEAYRIQCERIALDAKAQVNFDDALRSHAGDMMRFRRSQTSWADRRGKADVRVYFEPDQSVSDMAIAALDKIAVSSGGGGRAIVVNCQSAREVAYSYSTASRAIHHLGRSGLSFSTGHCGLVGGFQALEVALHLALAEGVLSVVVLAGDRWANVYPRVLGDWPVLSDGASAMTLRVQNSDAPTIYLMLETLDRTGGAALSRPDDEGETLCADICQKLMRLVAESGLPTGKQIAVLSPDTTAGVARRVDARLGRTGNFSVMRQSSPNAHFGAADLFFRLSRAISDSGCVSNGKHDWVLVWDCDPSGTLGACLVSTDAFALQLNSEAA